MLCCCCQVLRRKYGKEADIWSCGVMLYILLSGMPPFYGDNEQQIFDSILRNKVDFESDPWPKVSEPAKVSSTCAGGAVAS
jgi:calcium-dependent protein kinase